jgi:hypothetical protein
MKIKKCAARKWANRPLQGPIQDEGSQYYLELPVEQEDRKQYCRISLKVLDHIKGVALLKRLVWLRYCLHSRLSVASPFFDQAVALTSVKAILKLELA